MVREHSIQRLVYRRMELGPQPPTRATTRRIHRRSAHYEVAGPYGKAVHILPGGSGSEQAPVHQRQERGRPELLLDSLAIQGLVDQLAHKIDSGDESAINSKACYQSILIDLINHLTGIEEYRGLFFQVLVQSEYVRSSQQIEYDRKKQSQNSRAGEGSSYQQTHRRYSDCCHRGTPSRRLHVHERDGSRVLSQLGPDSGQLASVSCVV